MRPLPGAAGARAAGGVRGPRARQTSGPGRRGRGSLRAGRRSRRLGPHSPPGPAPSGGSMRPAAFARPQSPCRCGGDSAPAPGSRLPAPRIGQQPGGRGGGEEPAGRGPQLLRGRGRPILPAAPRHRCGPAPARARPLSAPALRTPARRRPRPHRRPRGPGRGLPPLSAHSPRSRADGCPFVTLRPRYVWGANYEPALCTRRGKGGADTRDEGP